MCRGKYKTGSLTNRKKKEQFSTTKIGSSTLSLEVYNLTTNFTQREQNVAKKVSNPVPYQYGVFPKNFKLWVFNQGDQWVSGSIRNGKIWESKYINLIWDRFRTLAKLRSQMDAHSKVNGSSKESRQWGMLDLGANIGTITVPAAQIIHHFGLGPVTAVEAVPLHALLLRKSIEQNHLDNILVIRQAISDKSGRTLNLKIDARNRGGATISESVVPDPNSGLTAASAVTVTLDQIYELYPKRLRDTFIWKIDIECYEGYMFSGASKFLEEVRPCWIIAELKRSCLDRNGPLKYNEIISLLGKYGHHLEYYSIYSGEDHTFRHEDCCRQHESCVFK